MTLFPDDEPDARWSDRSVTRDERRASSIGWLLITGAIAGTVVLGLLPAPYVVERPGPVFDTLGDITIDDKSLPVIEISGTPTFDTDGRLDLLTVSIDGSRDSPLSWIEIAAAWFQSSRTVVPVESVYPDGQTREESDQESAAEMANSQQEAVAAAFEELDIPYDVVVAGVIEDAPADGVLENGDHILTAGGQKIDGITALRDAIAANGTTDAMPLTISRKGTERQISLIPVEASVDDPTPVIGIQAGYEFPYDVTIHLDNVGGPSAGTMFALGVYDKLTDGPLTGGVHVAGTGTIRADGTVGPIGGIRQKMFGAQEAGATVFLAPVENCAEVTDHIPAGLDVFSIATLDDAIEVVDTVGMGRATSNLERCPS